MKYGKKVCQSLKIVRKQIADANEIPYEITECHHEGNCPGTCPKCESEVRYIENQLNIRRATGKAVSLIGLSLGISAAFTSCASKPEPIEDPATISVEEDIIDGDLVVGELINPNDSVQSDETEGENDILQGVVETPPVFPGGDAALMRFVKENLKYPEKCAKDSIQGRVTVTFDVETDGSITNVKVMRSPNDDLSEEAIRIVKLMPKWAPGKQYDKTVRTKFVLPVSFRLE